MWVNKSIILNKCNNYWIVVNKGGKTCRPMKMLLRLLMVTPIRDMFDLVTITVCIHPKEDFSRYYFPSSVSDKTFMSWHTLSKMLVWQGFNVHILYKLYFNNI